MTDTFTPTLKLRLRAIGSRMPPAGWANMLHSELAQIDHVIAEVCTPDQVKEIRERLKSDAPGVIL